MIPDNDAMVDPEDMQTYRRMRRKFYVFVGWNIVIILIIAAYAVDLLSSGVGNILSGVELVKGFIVAGLTIALIGRMGSCGFSFRRWLAEKAKYNPDTEYEVAHLASLAQDRDRRAKLNASLERLRKSAG